MILYVNGDSHSAGAEAVNQHCFAKDDTNYRHLGRVPHPDNESVSYGALLADNLNLTLQCSAESGGSNTRIIRTTRDYLKNNPTPTAIIIGWATWEREEFLFDNIYYQFSGGWQIEDWPKHVVDYYKQWAITCNPLNQVAYWHDEIFQFHKELLEANIPHLFFNTYHSFNNSFITPVDWNNNYIDPYNHSSSYYYWLEGQGFKTVPNSFHYRADAHRAWADFLLPHLTNILKESIITT